MENDWCDSTFTRMAITTALPPNPVQPSGTPFNSASGVYDAAHSQFVLTWDSAPGREYSVLGSTDLKTWTAVQTGIDSGGTTTSFGVPLGTPPAPFRFYRVSQP